MNTSKILKLTLSGVALAAASATFVSCETPQVAQEGKCHGHHGCKGQSDCATDKHACKGMNECKGQGYQMMSKEACKAAGGTFESH